MFPRLLNLSKSNSFFIFGPRGSGKSTYLREHLQSPHTFYIDLLEDRFESRYRRNPDLLLHDVLARQKSQLDWVIVDEIQKIPKMLDVVHKLIEEHQIKFALTGSSSRKLKREGANLLAGRAFTFHMFPLTFLELGQTFNLNDSQKYLISQDEIPSELHQVRCLHFRDFLNEIFGLKLT